MGNQRRGKLFACYTHAIKNYTICTPFFFSIIEEQSSGKTVPTEIKLCLHDHFSLNSLSGGNSCVGSARNHQKFTKPDLLCPLLLTFFSIFFPLLGVPHKRHKPSFVWCPQPRPLAGFSYFAPLFLRNRPLMSTKMDLLTLSWLRAQSTLDTHMNQQKYSKCSEISKVTDHKTYIFSNFFPSLIMILFYNIQVLNAITFGGFYCTLKML